MVLVILNISLIVKIQFRLLPFSSEEQVIVLTNFDSFNLGLIPFFQSNIFIGYHLEDFIHFFVSSFEISANFLDLLFFYDHLILENSFSRGFLQILNELEPISNILPPQNFDPLNISMHHLTFVAFQALTSINYFNYYFESDLIEDVFLQFFPREISYFHFLDLPNVSVQQKNIINYFTLNFFRDEHLQLFC